MLKPTLFKKLLFVSILLALIPLAISGYKLIDITEVELKSAANDQLSATVEQLASRIDDRFINVWAEPLLTIRYGIESGDLVGLSSVAKVGDMAWLQLEVEDAQPVMVAQQAFADRLNQAGLDPVETMLIAPGSLDIVPAGMEQILVGEMRHIAEIDSWLLPLVAPLPDGIDGRPATLSAWFSLDEVFQDLATHPFNRNGLITLIGYDGGKLFDPDRTDLSGRDIVRQMTDVMKTESRPTQVALTTDTEGENVLAAVAFPTALTCGVLAERSEADAYRAVRVMEKQLAAFASIGLIVAALLAVIISRGISGPIVEIGDVAAKVGDGDFSVRMRDLPQRDEVGDLAQRINDMISGLRERFELSKFVSDETLAAVAQNERVELGGTRQRATVFFSDIRGFTAFSEKVEPEVVIEMLNTYLSVQADIVKEHDGDIDKFVGDELVAVFKGSKMAENAARCALHIQREITKLNAERDWDIAIGIGINTGDMVFGAMGSKDRMDYTILGDNVNLGARLCSAAGRHKTILSNSSYQEAKNVKDLHFEAMEPISVKGKTEPIEIYELMDPEYSGS